MLSNSDIAAVMLAKSLLDDDRRIALFPTKRDWHVTLSTRVGKTPASVGFGFTRQSVDHMPEPAMLAFVNSHARALTRALQDEVAKLRDAAREGLGRDDEEPSR